MTIVEIIRLEETDHGTLGILKLDKRVFCATLEPPDKENAQNVSSIPAQQYMCRRVQSPRFGNTFEVQNVPGRSHVLFHAGNTEYDTAGCILLGELGGHDGPVNVVNSKQTMESFLAELHNEAAFHLTIKEEY